MVAVAAAEVTGTATYYYDYDYDYYYYYYYCCRCLASHGLGHTAWGPMQCQRDKCKALAMGERK